MAMCQNFLHHTREKIHLNGKEIIYAIASGDEQNILLLGLKRFTKVVPINLKEKRRLIAKKLINKGKYCF